MIVVFDRYTKTDIYREWRYSSTVLDGGEWSALRPGYFNPGESVPVTHWIGVWEGPRGGLDAVE
jgi:hypothetical protein